MPEPHNWVTDYANELISTPRAHVRMELRQDEGGISLLYEGESLVECTLTSQGMMAAGFMAQSLGVKLPALGESVPVRVSTGVLFRATSIAGLDFDIEESFIILERLLEEAAAQRSSPSEAV